MIDMTQLGKADARGLPPQPTVDPNPPQNQTVGGGYSVPTQPVSGGTGYGDDFVIPLPQPIPGLTEEPNPPQNNIVGGGQPVVQGVPSPVDGLYKWADYGQGQRPQEWTKFGDLQDQWNQMGAHIYRNPSWPGHMTWNPYWGFMNYGNLTKQLKGGYEGSIQDMPGFERLGEKWWEDYNPSDIYGAGTTEWPGSQPGGGGGGGGGGDYGSTAFPWSDWMNQGGTAEVPGQTWSAPYQAEQGTGYQFPSQWNTASNTMTRMAQGTRTPTPWTWQRAGEQALKAARTGFKSDVPDQWWKANVRANKMGQEGMPVSQDLWYQQAKNVAQTDIENAIKQAAEQAGLSGLRWSTPMGRSAQEIAAQRMGEVGLEWTGREMDALEAARQRMMQTIPLQFQIGQGIAGLDEASKGRMMQSIPYMMQQGQLTTGLSEADKYRQLQAAGMLPGLGQMYDQAPQDWAQRMFGMGQQMYGQQQGAYDRAYQDFMRMAPEYNPWMQSGMNFGGMQTNMVPQQFNPSTLSQILQGLF